MKTVHFVRHYKLAYPFDHWTNMTWAQFKSFTEGEADPDISLDGIDGAIKDEIKLETVELILSGTAKRTVNTALHIAKICNASCRQDSSEIFNEIPSQIEENLTDIQFQQMKQTGKLAVKKRRVLGEAETYKRLHKIDQYLKNVEETNIVVVSCSYIIGQLNYFYSAYDGSKEFRVEDAEPYEIGGWIQGFQTEI